MKSTKLCIIEALYEIINGLHGERDEQHTQWEKEAKNYLKHITKDKNISIDYDKKIIEIQNSEATKTLYLITIK